MKKIQILIITLVAVLVLGCTTFAVLYFATDVFKSDKELFYKNISQIDLNELMDTMQATKYQERLKSEKFKNEGSVSIGVNIGEEMSINERFNYTSQVDNANKLADSSVTINKEGNDLLTINYLRNGDLYGLQFKDIVSQYIVLENNNLKEFAQKLGIQDVTNIPDKINLDEITKNQDISLEDINLEEIELIVNKYINIIIEQIPKENYSKVEDGYKLIIDIKTLQNILIELLNNLKDDEQVFNLVNSIISTVDSSMKLDFEEYQEFFQEGIEELSNEIEENFTIAEIITYKDGTIYAKIGMDSEEEKSYVDAYIKQNNDKMVLELNRITKTTFEDNEMKITINKNVDTTENDACEIEVVVKDDNEEVGNISIETTRKGNLDSNNIQDNVSLSMVAPENNLEINLEYNNNKTFDSSIEIEEFTPNNHAVINELDYIQISNLITNLNNRITQKSGLSAIEFIGGAGIGIISTLTMDSQEMAITGGMIGGAALNVYITVSSSIFDRAQNAMQETQNAMEQEQILLQQMEDIQGQILSE